MIQNTTHKSILGIPNMLYVHMCTHRDINVYMNIYKINKKKFVKGE